MIDRAVTSDFPDVLTDDLTETGDGEDDREEREVCHDEVSGVMTVQGWNAALSQLHSYLTYWRCDVD